LLRDPLLFESGQLTAHSLLHSFEQIRLEFCVLRVAGGGEMEHFVSWHRAKVLSQPREQRRLRLVLHKGLMLALRSFRAHFDPRCNRRWRGGHAIGQLEIGRRVIELLCRVWRHSGRNLSGVAVGAAGPVEGLGGEGTGHGVVGVAGEAAVGSESDDDVGAKAADTGDQLSDDLMEVRAVEFAVGISEYLAVRDAEEAARGLKLGGAQLGEFLIAAGGSAILGGGPGGEADHRDFDAAIGVEGEGSAEGSGFVVRMGGDAEESEHGSNQLIARAVSRFGTGDVAPSPLPHSL